MKGIIMFRVDNRCRVINCYQNHGRHFCKVCGSQDSDHFSSNCQKKNNQFFTLDHLFLKPFKPKCRVKQCNQKHNSHYCKICKDNDSQHLSQNCKFQRAYTSCRVKQCKQKHQKHYCKNCNDSDSNHFSHNCKFIQRPKDVVIQKSCKGKQIFQEKRQPFRFQQNIPKGFRYRYDPLIIEEIAAQVKISKQQAKNLFLNSAQASQLALKLPSQFHKQYKFSSDQVKCLLAAMITGKQKPNFQKVFQLNLPKLKILKIYSALLAVSNNKIDQQGIYFGVSSIQSDQQENLLKGISQSELPYLPFELTESPMEDSKEVIISFANKRLGGGSLGRGSVQQELMFAQFPFLYVSMLLFKQIKDNQAIIAKKIRRSVYSTGYGYGASFLKKSQSECLKQFISVDAIDFNQMRINQYKASRRQLIKLSAGLKSYEGREVVTGNWGSGAFKGTVQLKFLLQGMVFSYFKVKGTYSRPSANLAKLNHIFANYKIKQLFKKLKQLQFGNERNVSEAVMRAFRI